MKRRVEVFTVVKAPPTQTVVPSDSIARTTPFVFATKPGIIAPVLRSIANRLVRATTGEPPGPRTWLKSPPT